MIKYIKYKLFLYKHSKYCAERQRLRLLESKSITVHDSRQKIYFGYEIPPYVKIKHGTEFEKESPFKKSIRRQNKRLFLNAQKYGIL